MTVNHDGLCEPCVMLRVIGMISPGQLLHHISDISDGMSMQRPFWYAFGSECKVDMVRTGLTSAWDLI